MSVSLREPPTFRIVHELLGQLAYRNETFAENALSVEQCGAIIDAVHSDIITGGWWLSYGDQMHTYTLTRLTLSGTSGRTILRHILRTKTSVPISQLLDELSLRTVDPTSVEALCDEAIRTFPEEAELIHGGKKNILMKLVGYVMKASRGRADAKLTRRILERKLAARK